MNKTLLYGLLLTCVTFFGCKGEYDDWADPQGFEPEEAVGVSLSASAAAAINMAEIDSETVSLFTPSATIPEGASVVSYSVTLDGKKKLNADLSGRVSTEELISAVTELYGKRPVERTLSAVVAAQIKQNEAGLYTKSSAFNVLVTLEAPVISTAYYLVGDMAGWDATSMIAFNHSGKDVYEDPIFTLTFTTSADNQYWKIIPQENVDNDFWANPGVVGTAVDGDASLEGALVNVGANAGKIEAAGMYKMTLNMMDYTYTLQKLAFGEFVYIPGNHQDWNPGNAPALRGASFDGKYEGFCYLNGDFKFTKERNWDGEYNYNDFITFSEGLAQGGGTNINMATAGLYQMVADVANGSLTAAAVSWGIIGDATAGGWDADQDMTWDAEKKCLTATLTLTDGSIKFRANDDWAINLGGTTDNLSQDGNNLSVTAGTYYIELYLERTDSENMYCTITKQ
ncbi:hypothetical protein M2480_000664 [Parabacteroides sp. PFB2-12]|uniref:Outer membrane protein SusF domain-containing protein n=1 Tax=unclassified Parabacteroides TaxID=2649774 RepID=UPI00247494F4|nr:MULTISPECIES: DUF5115 domain-containing protein [unclassified Parabacteroides]MDH6342001.1 hypothetical protein [Parabacteroides sp. PM6-13]MDH6389699.1 hypothetical protein [Parabacteroides sp. PFB2-12]